MQLEFSHEQFTAVYKTFCATQPTPDDNVPVDFEVITALRGRLDQAAKENQYTLELDQEQIDVLAICFEVGADENPDIDDEVWETVIDKFNRAGSDGNGRE